MVTRSRVWVGGLFELGSRVFQALAQIVNDLGADRLLGVNGDPGSAHSPAPCQRLAFAQRIFACWYISNTGTPSKLATSAGLIVSISRACCSQTASKSSSAEGKALREW
jgi:hypothetical protein